MKKQYLFSALAFSAFLASCSNEIETVAESVKQEAEMEEIVGADLVANGMTINVGGTESRAMNGSWLTTDLLALAWYNVTKNIYDPQDKDAWEGMDSEDPKIYGNHKFTPNENGEFVTESNVYQGGHFVYFPYKREAKVQKKTVEVNKLAYTTKPENDPNPNVYEYDFYNKAFHLSAQDYIDVDDVVDGKLVKQFVMSPMVNAINVHADSKVEGDALKALEITEVKIASDRTVFDQAFDIVPTEIPAVVRDKNDNIDEALTIKALDAYARGLGADYKTNISREVKPGFKLTQETNNLVLYALPTNPGYKGNKNGLRMIVSVKSEHGLVGKFTIQANEDETAQNNASIERFQELLKKVNVESESKKESLQEIRRNGSNWYPLNTKIELTNDNVAIEWNIANKDQWDDAVALASDLGKDVTFTLTDEVEFTESINLPEGIKLTVAGDGSMVIDGDIEWPNTDDLDVTAANIVVEEDATLSINGEEGNRNTLVANITNNGIIALNEYGTVGAATSGNVAGVNVENQKGRIEVKYGSYVYADGGIVAFEVSTDTPAYQINYLITDDETDADDGQALVNTLVINADNELNLNKTNDKETTYDPYHGEVTTIPAAELTDLSGIDIEMNGGTLIGNKALTKSVMNVKAITGENIIKDVNIEENLKVEVGAEVTVDATEFTHGSIKYKHDVNIKGDMYNKGIINANVNIYTANIDNEKGKTIVAEGYTIRYENEYIQGGIADGRILAKVDTESEGVVATATTLEELNSAISNAEIKTIKVSDDIFEGTIDLKGKIIVINDGHTHLKKVETLKNGTIVGRLCIQANSSFENIRFEEHAVTDIQLYAVQVEKAVNVTFKDCVFYTAGRPLETAYQIACKVTVDNCRFMAHENQNNPYFNPLGTGGKVIVKNSIFEQSLTCCFELQESQFEIEGNVFEQQFGGFANKNLTSAAKTFLENLNGNNTFNNEYKWALWNSTTLKDDLYKDLNF